MTNFRLVRSKKHLSYLTLRWLTFGRSAPITTAEWINTFRYSNSPYVWNMKLKEIFVSERFNEFHEFFSRRLLWTHKFEHKILIRFQPFSGIQIPWIEMNMLIIKLLMRILSIEVKAWVVVSQWRLKCMYSVQVWGVEAEAEEGNYANIILNGNTLYLSSLLPRPAIRLLSCTLLTVLVSQSPLLNSGLLLKLPGFSLDTWHVSWR